MPENSSPTTPVDQPQGADLGMVDGLVQLSFLVQSILTRVGAAHDLSVTQLRLLGIVRDRDAGMMELAAHLGLDKSSVTGLIDRAEKRSLVRRSRASGDGRAVCVSITPTGLELVHIGAAAIQTEITALTAALSPRQRSQLSALATAVVHGAYDGRPGPA